MIIWLASYPRSGNTFLRTILKSAFGQKTYSIYNDRQDISVDKTIRNITGHHELSVDFDFEKARKSKRIYFIKTHELFGKENEHDKVIYLIRDGREATVSYYHYLKNFSQNRYTLLEIINGHTFAGSWGNHFFSWRQCPPESILFLSFEKITKFPQKSIQLICDFTGLKPSAEPTYNFNDLQKINSQFFRSGKLDSYKNELSQYEQKYFWMVNGQAIREAKYTKRIPDLTNELERDELLFKHTELTIKFNKQKENEFKQKEKGFKQKENEFKQKENEFKQKENEF
ncbi:MAG: sulfotransferase domain-containing protein, partial [Leptospirales bacterium]